MRNVTIRFSEEELSWLKETAAKEMRSVSLLVRWIIAEYRQREEANREPVRRKA